MLLIWSTGNRFHQACVNNILSSSCYQTMPCCKIHDQTINLELESPCISIHTLINKRPLNHRSIVVWCLIQWTPNFSCAMSQKIYSRSRHLLNRATLCDYRSMLTQNTLYMFNIDYAHTQTFTYMVLIEVLISSSVLPLVSGTIRIIKPIPSIHATAYVTKVMDIPTVSATRETIVKIFNCNKFLWPYFTINIQHPELIWQKNLVHHDAFLIFKHNNVSV